MDPPPAKTPQAIRPLEDTLPPDAQEHPTSKKNVRVPFPNRPRPHASVRPDAPFSGAAKRGASRRGG
eukprot:5988135-Pyramimonas_sp.AAC.1